MIDIIRKAIASQTAADLGVALAGIVILFFAILSVSQP